MSEWAWSVAYQRDEGHRLVLMERKLRHSYVIDLGVFFLDRANGRMWRVAKWLRFYDLACWLIHKGDKNTKTLGTFPITPEQRRELLGDGDWIGEIVDDSD